jgi:hypothetical protein
MAERPRGPQGSAGRSPCGDVAGNPPLARVT